MWLHSLKVAQLLRSAACLHTNQSRSYLNHLVNIDLMQHEYVVLCTTKYYPKQSSMFRSLLTNSMEQSPSSDANNPSDNQEIPYILCSPKVHYGTHKCPPPVPIRSHSTPVHATPSYFLKLHFHIIVLSKPRLSKWSPSLRFLHQNFLCASPLSHTCHMPHQSHPNHPNVI